MRDFDLHHGSVLVCVSSYHVYYGQLFFPWSCDEFLQFMEMISNGIIVRFIRAIKEHLFSIELHFYEKAFGRRKVMTN